MATIDLPKGMTAEQALAIRAGLRDLMERFNHGGSDLERTLRWWFQDLQGFTVSAITEGFARAGGELLKFPAAPSWVRKYIAVAHDEQRRRIRQYTPNGPGLCGACGTERTVSVPTPSGVHRVALEHLPGCRVRSVVVVAAERSDGKVSIEYLGLDEWRRWQESLAETVEP